MAEERVQRRLAAILAADVVGYSRMMRDDEAGTLAQIKSLRREIFEPKIRDHNGRIFNTSGDGVLVEFASVVDAVQHALDVQRALDRRNADILAERKVELRMGINLGDIIVDGDDVYGDGVNIAARLESLAPPGGIFVSATVYESVRNIVAADYEDLGEQTVKNINRPIRIIDVSQKSVLDNPIDTLARLGEDDDRAADSKRRSIAVLPFDNMGNDASDDHLCDGMTEDIITALSHIDDLSIVARTTTMTFKGRSMDIQEVGRQLGANFVIEGSARRAGDRIRVTAQLIDVSTGHHAWADRYDRELTNVFDLQDDITANIAAALQVKFVEGDQARSWHRAAGDFESWRTLLEARSNQRRNTRMGLTTANRLLSGAVAKNPNSAVMCAHLAFNLYTNARHGWASNFEASLREAEELARIIHGTA
jgi:adenylate cyclase